MNEGQIVTQGTVEEIHAKVHGSKVICISVLEDCDRAKTLIEQYPNAEIESIQNNNIKIRLAAGNNQLAELNSYLVNQGIKVCGFFEKKVDLEELFMKISG